MHIPCFVKSRLTLLLLLLVLAMCAIATVQAATEAELISFVETYFEARYTSMQNLALSDGFRDFFDPALLEQPLLINEPDRLQAYLAYRAAQKDDRHLAEGWQVSLSYPALRVFSTHTEIIVVEEYQYAYAGAPDELYRGSISHALTLKNGPGASWKIIRDEYLDPEGVLLQLDQAFHSSSGGKERMNLIAELLPHTEAVEATRIRGEADTMKDFPTQVVLFLNQSVGWIEGQALPLDPHTRLTPMSWDDEIYLPVRVLVENLGGSIRWTPLDRRSEAVFGDHTLIFSTFEREVMLDGERIPMRRSNTLVGNRSYLPASLLARFFERELYTSASGCILLTHRSLSEEQQTALFTHLDDMNQGSFSIVEFPSLAGAVEAEALICSTTQELLGLSAEETGRFLPHLRSADPYALLAAKEVDIIVAPAPKEKELLMLRSAKLDLDLLPLSQNLVVAVRRGEALRSPARRLAAWLQETTLPEGR